MKNKVFLSIIFILILLIVIRAFSFSSKYISDDSKKEYSLFIVSKYKENENMVSYIATLNKDKFIIKIYNNGNINLEEYTNLKYGDVLSIKGKIIVPEYMNNPGEFNYRYYLYSNNIYGEISVDKINLKWKAKLNLKEKILKHIYNYKEYLGKILEKYVASRNVSLAKSIIYGETSNLDSETQTSFEQVGLSHTMAISGSNITSIVLVASFLLSSVKLKGKVQKIILISIITVFLIITGGSLSTLRAGIMSITVILQTMLNLKINPLKSLLLSIVLILIYSPFSIYNTGCILSFLATLGIIIFFKPLNKISNTITKKLRSRWLRKIFKGIFLNLSLVISVQIMILPVQINSFNVISPTQIIFNISTSYISNIIILLGAIFVLFSYVPIFNCILLKIINILLNVLMILINTFKKVSLNIPVMDLPVFVIAIYYCIVCSFILKIYLKEILLKKKYILNKFAWKKYNVIQILLILLMIIAMILNRIYFVRIASFIYFFNVGQGELSYIKSGKYSAIVDIGSLKTNLAFNTVSNYFKMKNITCVDVIIISHMHTDHINGLERYLENYKVGLVIYSKTEESKVYNDFKNIVSKYNVKIKEVKAGDIYKIGDINIEVILPGDKLLKVEDSINANSLICKVTVKDIHIMYMGDGTNETEKEILNLYELNNIDILKVGHHGSKTSTTEEYIKRLLPEYAVISAKKSYYNHPHESVLALLKKYNVQVYITEKNGAIKFNMYNLRKKNHNIFKE